jgi:hypothetical protein
MNANRRNNRCRVASRIGSGMVRRLRRPEPDFRANVPMTPLVYGELK